MGVRAEPSGLVLTAEDAGVIRGMIQRGDRHHDIAAFFGVNPGRIADIKFGVLGIPASSRLIRGNCRRRGRIWLLRRHGRKTGCANSRFSKPGAEAPLDVT